MAHTCSQNAQSNLPLRRCFVTPLYCDDLSLTTFALLVERAWAAALDGVLFAPALTDVPLSGLSFPAPWKEEGTLYLSMYQKWKLNGRRRCSSRKVHPCSPRSEHSAQVSPMFSQHSRLVLPLGSVLLKETELQVWPASWWFLWDCCCPPVTIVPIVATVQPLRACMHLNLSILDTAIAPLEVRNTGEEHRWFHQDSCTSSLWRWVAQYRMKKMRRCRFECLLVQAHSGTSIRLEMSASGPGMSVHLVTTICYPEECKVHMQQHKSSLM